MMIREHNGIRYTLAYEVNGNHFDTEKAANLYRFEQLKYMNLNYRVDLVIINAEPV